jgi:2-desacetyl-2-hydroxyethyl bacteriochlorophyllide A dehydrogenase
MTETHVAQAVWFGARRSVDIRDEPVAAPQPGEIRVRTLVSALSHGTERLVFRGEVPSDLALDLPTLRGSWAFPIKYGYAAVGRIIDVGPGVDRFIPGDTVFALHPHQTVFTLPAALAVPVPRGVDVFAASFIANLETAVNIVHDTPLRLGETAVVFGQGVVGLLVAQLLRRSGAHRVFAVEPSPLRRTLAERTATDGAFAPEDAEAHILAANDGRPADVAIEVSGVGAALQMAVDMVVDDGTVVVASGTVRTGDVDARRALSSWTRTIHSSQVGQLNPELGGDGITLVRACYGAHTIQSLELRSFNHPSRSI